MLDNGSDLEVERLAAGELPPLRHEPLDARGRQRALRRQQGDESAGRGLELLRRDDLADEAPLLQGARRQQLAGEQQPPGPGHADPLGQPHRAATARDQAEVGVRVADAGLLGRDDEVAGQEQLEPAGTGDPVDRCDDR